MAEYASKGLSNGVGIPALVLGSLGFLQSGGLANGLLGNNGQQDKIMGLMTENAQLKSQSYTDTQIRALSDEICGIRVEQARLGEQIARVADSASCGINAVQSALTNLQNIVSGLTRTVVPADNVMPSPVTVSSASGG